MIENPPLHCYSGFPFNFCPTIDLGAMMFEKIESDEASTKLSTTNTDMCYLRGNITSKLWTLTCCEMVNFNLNRTIYTIE